MADRLIGIITPWAEDELLDAMGGGSLDFGSSMFYSTDDDLYYADNVIYHGSGDAHIEGTMYVDGKVGRRCELAILIEIATSVDELPAGLVDEDEDICDLAKDKLEELGEEG